MGIWSEILCPVIFSYPGQLKLRPGILQVNFHEEKSFIIPESDIVFGSVLLDQLPLEEQRLLFVSDDVILEIPDALNQRAGFVLGETLPRGIEIGRQPLPEILGLTDIDDGPEAILVKIDPGFVGNLTQLLVELRFDVG